MLFLLNVQEKPKVPSKKKTYPDISINGQNRKHETYKIHELEEDEIPRLMEEVRQAGIYSRQSDNADNIKTVISNNPLSHIEGLVKHQLNRLLDGKFISINDLKTPSDFIHEEHFIRQTYCIKTNFLFNFLKDIVSMKTCPESIDERELSKLEASLRGLFFLAESQLTGGSKNKQSIFNNFIYFVWKGNGSKHMTIDGMWNLVIVFLLNKDNAGEFSFSWDGNTYAARLIVNKNGVNQIKIECETRGIAGARPKGKPWFSKNWPHLQRTFEKN